MNKKTIFWTMIIFMLLAFSVATIPLASAKRGFPASGSTEETNILFAVFDFLVEMGNGKELVNIIEWLRDGKVRWDDKLDSQGKTEGEIIYIRRDIMNPPANQNKPFDRDKDFADIVNLTLTLIHEKVHAHQGSYYVAFSEINDWNPLGGDNDADVDAWITELSVLDQWISKYYIWLAENPNAPKEEHIKKLGELRELLTTKSTLINDFWSNNYCDEGEFPWSQEDARQFARQAEQISNEYYRLKNDCKLTLDLKNIQPIYEEYQERESHIKKSVDERLKSIESRKTKVNHEVGEGITKYLSYIPPFEQTDRTGDINAPIILDYTGPEDTKATLGIRVDTGAVQLVVEGGFPEPTMNLHLSESTIISIFSAPDPFSKARKLYDEEKIKVILPVESKPVIRDVIFKVTNHIYGSGPILAKPVEYGFDVSIDAEGDVAGIGPEDILIEVDGTALKIETIREILGPNEEGVYTIIGKGQPYKDTPILGEHQVNIRDVEGRWSNPFELGALEDFPKTAPEILYPEHGKDIMEADPIFQWKVFQTLYLGTPVSPWAYELNLSFPNEARLDVWPIPKNQTSLKYSNMKCSVENVFCSENPPPPEQLISGTYLLTLHSDEQVASHFAFEEHRTVEFEVVPPKADEWIPDEFIIKFEQDMSPKIKNSIVTTGIDRIDALNAKYRIVRFELLFPKPPNITPRALDVYDSLGLGKIYLFGTLEPIVDPSLVETYANEPEVEYAEPNDILRSLAVPNDPKFWRQWGSHNHETNPGWPDADKNAPEAWDIETGSEVIIGIIDTGIARYPEDDLRYHEDLDRQIWLNFDPDGDDDGDGNPDDDGNGFIDDMRGWDFANDDNYPIDDHGHGTHVAGIIGAEANNVTGVAGQYWSGKSLMPVKVLDYNGAGNLDQVACGVYYAANNGARVINMSLGKYQPCSTLRDAVDYAYGLDCVVVAAVGNNNIDTIMYPASDHHTIAVGATDSNDERALWSSTSGSNYGKLDVVAPGSEIYSTYLNNTYKYKNGTSMAAPHVSGLAALILAENFTLTPNNVRNIICETADDEVGLLSEDVPGWDPYYGHGRINDYSALAHVAYPDPLAIPLLDDVRISSTRNPGKFAIAQPNDTLEIIGVRPPDGNDCRLTLRDLDQENLLGESDMPGDKVDFILMHQRDLDQQTLEGISAEIALSNPGKYALEWVKAFRHFSDSPPASFGTFRWKSAHVAEVCSIYLEGGNTYRIELTLSSGSFDLGMALFELDSPSYYCDRSAAVAIADANGPGQSESFTYRVSDTAWYALAIWSNNGRHGEFSISISVTTPVVLNEIYPYPNTTGGVEEEWIEIYNPGPADINLAGWKIRDGDGELDFTIPDSGTDWDGVLEADSYLVLHIGGTLDTPAEDIYANVLSDNNDGDSISLLMPQGECVDFVRYGNCADAPPAGTTWTGTNPQVPVQGQSLGRDANSTDTNDSSDWENTGGIDADAPTPGQRNIVVCTREFALNVYRGINMIGLPLEDEGIRRLRDILLRLQEDRENPNDLIIWYDRENGEFVSYRLNFPENSRANKEVVGGESYILVASEDGRITFRGNACDGGRVELPVYRGISMLCPPVNDSGISNVRDILLRLQENRVDPNDFIIWYDRGNNRFVGYRLNFPPDSPANKPVEGGEGYILIAGEDGTITFEGEAWQNTPTNPASPTMLLARDMISTSVLAVEGTVLREDTGTELNGVKVQVQNLSTHQIVTDTAGELAGSGRYAATFVDLLGGFVAKVGDVLEVTIVNPERAFVGEPIRYTLAQQDIQAGVVLLDVILSPIPKESALFANYPNPFNPDTWIPFKLSEASDVTIKIYNVSGQLVRTLYLGQKPAGTYLNRKKTAYWNGKNESGEEAASGVYLYSIHAGDFTATRKMILIK